MVNKPWDTHLAGQLVGFLGSLISRRDHGWKAPFAPLLLIVFCILLLDRINISTRTNMISDKNEENCNCEHHQNQCNWIYKVVGNHFNHLE